MVDISNRIKDASVEILPHDYPQYDLSFKIIIIGDAGVGKSSLTNKAIKNTFEDNYFATVGFEFYVFNVKLQDKIIKLQIWDTCGQELYRSLITNFYRNASLAIMVYAINHRESFNNIDIWLKELKTHSNPDSKIFLIGNKMDLEEERAVTLQQGETYSKQLGVNLFVESSAKNGFNVQRIFVEAAKILYDDFLKYKDNSDPRRSSIGSFRQIGDSKIKDEEDKPKKKGCCSS